jgi:hypothetical protein
LSGCDNLSEARSNSVHSWRRYLNPIRESEGKTMSLSYSDVFDIDHHLDAPEDLHPGDLVRTGPNYHPHFTVIAVSGDKVWVRNVETGVDALTDVTRCRLLDQPIALAAE